MFGYNAPRSSTHNYIDSYNSQVEYDYVVIHFWFSVGSLDNTEFKILTISGTFTSLGISLQTNILTA